MTFYTGEEALDFLNDDAGGSKFEHKFTSFKVGDTLNVKVINFGDFVAVPTYSIFKSVNTFTPDPLPKLSDRGYPIDDLTPFDVVSKYYRDKSEAFGDENSNIAYQYAIKIRYAVGLYDLDKKECIVVDLSKGQAKTVLGSIQANSKRLGNRAFEITKGERGAIQINPVMPDELSDAHEKAFKEAPDEFDKTLFENLYFKRDKKGMLEALVQSGINPADFGYDVPASVKKQEEQPQGNPFSTDTETVNEDDLPF